MTLPNGYLVMAFVGGCYVSYWWGCRSTMRGVLRAMSAAYDEVRRDLAGRGDGPRGPLQ